MQDSFNFQGKRSSVHPLTYRPNNFLGSFSTASCTNCKYNTTSDAIRDDILNQVYEEIFSKINQPLMYNIIGGFTIILLLNYLVGNSNVSQMSIFRRYFVCHETR